MVIGYVADSGEPQLMVITSSKGHVNVLYKGYSYRKNYICNNKNKIAWRCTSSNCKGRLSTSNDINDRDQPVQENGRHNHPPKDRINMELDMYQA